MKYIGIKVKTRDSWSSNEGSIWELQKNGKYRCINEPPYLREVTEEQILQDYQKGYLQKIDLDITEK